MTTLKQSRHILHKLLFLLYALSAAIQCAAAFSATIDGATTTSRETFAPHNFGPASTRDTILFTAERPGNPKEKNDPVPDSKVIEWMDYVKARGVNRVVALLDENEMKIYSNLPSLYQNGGLQFTIQSMSDPEAPSKLFNLLQSCAENNESVVTHCTGGIGRCGRVCAGWLCFRYGLTPEEATKETLACARDYNIHRAGNADLLEEWLKTSGL
jgi:hypothetical protein